MGISPPPTPPSGPVKADQQRFKPITSPCEWIEKYRPGGYHPVALGDTFNDGQYKVIRKLGWGSFSTVWLARDLRNETYVAVKILVSRVSSSESTNEVRILHKIADLTQADSSCHITRLLDEFEHRGPNGIHKCLVFEPMGPNVDSMVGELPQFKPRKYGMLIRYPTWMARSILKQSLQGLHFLYKNGISHGDFKPGNILFTLKEIDSIPEHDLRQTDAGFDTTSLPVERLDEKEDRWAPKHLSIAQPLASFTYHGQGFKVKLSDMGGAYFMKFPPKKSVTPAGLRAPEFILTGTINDTLDIWSFGCLIFELITGQPLFRVSEGEFRDDDHLLSMTEHLGPLPEELYNHWKNSSLYFTPDRKIFNWQLGGIYPDEKPFLLDDWESSMEDLFDDAELELDEEESLQVKALIRRILQYDPAKRPSPAELLLDPWFRGIDVDGVSEGSV